MIAPGRALIACASLVTVLAVGGCGSTRRAAQARPLACPAVVASTLGHVAMHLYGEAVSSDVTRVAQQFVEQSGALRTAVARDDRGLASDAARRLIATRHMVRLRVVRNGRVLADIGPTRVLSPLSGVLHGSGGQPIGSYEVATQSAGAYVSAVRGLTLAPAVITHAGRALASSVPGGGPAPPDQGAYRDRGALRANFTFPARLFPHGALRIHVVPSYAYAAQVCGASPRDTVRGLLSGTLLRIYNFEAGSGETFAQAHRVQRSEPLLQAVAHHDRRATRRAIVGLLNQHIVRLRVSDNAHLLADVGGPYVLAPVRRDLKLAGTTIGHVVLSIQDDLGYLLLSRRLAHVALVMRMGGRTVMSALSPTPTDIPAQGPLRTHGHDYEVYSFTVEAFPTGPLQVFALIPFPYR